MTFKVSVIVPVYNVEKYLEKCLTSLVNQTLNELEIIVVNDGSTDGSQAIIDRFVKEHPKKVFSVIKPNGGLSDARNYGLNFAHAEYIGFIDSDDSIEPAMYQSMYDLAIAKDSELIVCDIEYVFEDGRSPYMLKGMRDISGKDIRHALFLSPLFAWNKLYHRNLFFKTGLRYPLGLWYEDLPVTLPIFSIAKNPQYVDQAFVHYLQRKQSIMSVKNHSKLNDIFVVLEKVQEYFTQQDALKLYQKEIEYVFIEQLMLYGSFRMFRSDDHTDLMTKSLRLIHRYYPQWKKNEYTKQLKMTYRFYLWMMHPSMFMIYRFLLNYIR